VKLRAAQTGFVDITMAAQVIFNRINLPKSAQTGDGRIMVGNRDI
jgi:hypothetical protein